MVDAAALGAVVSDGVQVRVLSPAPRRARIDRESYQQKQKVSLKLAKAALGLF